MPPETEPDLKDFKVDDVVLYDHPTWGPGQRGRVLSFGLVPAFTTSAPEEPDPTKLVASILVHDLSANGAREWWPAEKCRIDPEWLRLLRPGHVRGVPK